MAVLHETASHGKLNERFCIKSCISDQPEIQRYITVDIKLEELG